MAEKRRLDRIKLVMVGKLLWNDLAADCQIENLSMDGALISTRGPSMPELQTGDNCILQMPQDEDLALAVQAEVVHHLFPFLGLRFFGLNLQKYAMLEYVLQQEKEKQAFLQVNGEHPRLLPPRSVS